MAAEPHFAFSPGGSLFALQSQPPAVRIAGDDPRVIDLPAAARESTLGIWPVWESARHLLLPLTGTSDALRVDTRTGECETAAMPGGVLTHPLIR